MGLKFHSGSKFLVCNSEVKKKERKKNFVQHCPELSKILPRDLALLGSLFLECSCLCLTKADSSALPLQIMSASSNSPLLTALPRATALPISLLPVCVVLPDLKSSCGLVCLPPRCLLHLESKARTCANSVCVTVGFPDSISKFWTIRKACYYL